MSGSNPRPCRAQQKRNKKAERQRQAPAETAPAAAPVLAPQLEAPQPATAKAKPTPFPVAAKPTPASISGPVVAKGSKRYGGTKQRQGKPTTTPAPKPTSTAAPKRDPLAHKTGKRSGNKPNHHATPTPPPAPTPAPLALEECKTSDGVPQGQAANISFVDEAKTLMVEQAPASVSPSSSLSASFSSDVLSSSSTIVPSSPRPSSPSSAAPPSPTTSDVVEHIVENEGSADDGDKAEAHVEAAPQTSDAPAQPAAIVSAGPAPAALHHQPEQQQEPPQQQAQQAQQALHSPPPPVPFSMQQSPHSPPPPAPAAQEAVLFDHIGEPVYVEKTDRGVYYRYKSDLDRSGSISISSSSSHSGYGSHHSSGHGSYGGHGSRHGSQASFAPDAFASYFPLDQHSYGYQQQHPDNGYNNAGHHSPAGSIDLSGSNYAGGYTLPPQAGYHHPNAPMPPPPPQQQVYHQQQQGYMHPQQQQQQHIQQPVAWMRWQRRNQPYPSSHYHHPNAPWQEVAFYRPGYYEGPMIFPTRHFHAPMSPLRRPARHGGKHWSHRIPSSSGRRPRRSMEGDWHGPAQYGGLAEQGGYMGGYY